MAAATTATAKTVSQPLQLDASASTSELSGNKRRRIVKPSGKITLTSLTENNLGTVKKIISVVLNQRYADKLYKEALDTSLEDINKLIYYNDIPVGTIVCRMQPKAKGSKDEILEILALAILAPYRSLGLGTALLNAAIEAAKTTEVASAAATKTSPATAGRKKATKVLAYTQEGNDDAKRFYTEKGGFIEVELKQGYYSNQDPSGAWVLEKSLV
ncbi:N-acetyltransferase 5 [Naganishia albida]|nr:N-acetyltransferase 5 [Naganishia albida]